MTVYVELELTAYLLGVDDCRTPPPLLLRLCIALVLRSKSQSVILNIPPLLTET